jgi:hypothetical protein
MYTILQSGKPVSESEYKKVVDLVVNNMEKFYGQDHGDLVKIYKEVLTGDGSYETYKSGLEIGDAMAGKAASIDKARPLGPDKHVSASKRYIFSGEYPIISEVYPNPQECVGTHFPQDSGPPGKSMPNLSLTLRYNTGLTAVPASPL